MKKKYLLSSLAALAFLSLAVFVVTQSQSVDPRTAYEQYLNQEYQAFPSFDPEEIGEMPKLDRPDLAGLADFYRTVDPALKTVPHWRTIEAYEDLKASGAYRTKSMTGSVQWTAHPTDMGGRTRAIMFDPNDPTKNKAWAGSVTGGLWYSDDPFHNTPWQPVNDFMPNLAISCLTYDPLNTTTFFAGTGESQTALIIYRESSGRGAGILRSSDAGQTWDIIPSTKNWAYVTDIIVREENGSSVIYAGVVSGFYKGVLHESGPTDGLYRSTDNGETWTQVLPNIPDVGFPYAPSDLVMSADNQRIYVGTTYHGEERRGAACLLYSDNGLDWTVNDHFNNEIEAQTTSKYPGRVMMCNAPSDANTVFALIASGYERINTHAHDDYVGYDCTYLIKSTDKGQTWTELNFPSGFAYLAWHALVVQVSPFNPNVIWVGGLDSYRTTDGGQNWTKLSSWSKMYSPNGNLDDYVHADIHVMQFRPGSDTDMLIGTDGGIFGTTTASAAVGVLKFKEYSKGYSTLQYYSGAIHPAAGARHIIGGLQDNGTMFYGNENPVTFANMLSGGDGALCFIDQDEPEKQITTVYHNAFYIYSGTVGEIPRSSGYKNDGSGTFINPMDYDWRDGVMFANEQDWEGNRANRLLVAGVTANSMNVKHVNLNTESSVPYSCIKWSEHSPAGQSLIYIGTESGRLFKLEDAVRSGITQELTPGNFPTGFISSIDHAMSNDTLMVTFSNYGVPSVWISTDGGQTWMDKEGNLPDIPVRWSIFHPKNGKQVMLATEMGTWTTNDIHGSPVVWTQNIDGLANVRVDQIKFRKSDNTVLAATHGRGMFTGIWDVDYSAGVNDIDIFSTVKVFPNPSFGAIEISFEAQHETAISITDASGRLINLEHVEGTAQTITRSYDLSDQPAGFYFVTLSNKDGRSVQKVLKQ